MIPALQNNPLPVKAPAVLRFYLCMACGTRWMGERAPTGKGSITGCAHEVAKITHEVINK